MVITHSYGSMIRYGASSRFIYTSILVFIKFLFCGDVNMKEIFCTWGKREERVDVDGEREREKM